MIKYQISVGRTAWSPDTTRGAAGTHALFAVREYDTTRCGDTDDGIASAQPTCVNFSHVFGVIDVCGRVVAALLQYRSDCFAERTNDLIACVIRLKFSTATALLFIVVVVGKILAL